MSKMNAGKSAALVLLVVATLGGLWPVQVSVQHADADHLGPAREHEPGSVRPARSLL